jgi:hypothetical protein
LVTLAVVVVVQVRLLLALLQTVQLRTVADSVADQHLSMDNLAK